MKENSSLTALSAMLPNSVYRRLVSSSIIRRLARGSFWALISSLIVRGSTFVQAIFLAHILGISSYGQWGILQNTIATASIFACFGLQATTTKHVAQWCNSEPLRLGRLLGLLQVTALILGSLVFLVTWLGAAKLAGHILLSPHLSNALIMVGAIVFLSAIATVYSGILQGLEMFNVAAMITGGATAIGVICTVWLSTTRGLMGALNGLLLATILNVAGSAWWAIRGIFRKGISPSLRHSWDEWREIRDFALPTALAGASVMCAIWAAQVTLVRQPGGYENMGAYQAATQWRTMVTFLPTQLMAAYLPVISSLVSEDKSKLRRLQQFMLPTMMVVTFLLGVPVMVGAPWLMGLYGSEFSGFGRILVVVVLIPVFDIAHVVLQNSAIANGYAWTLILSNIAMIVSVLIGIKWLIPAYLGIGLAITLLLGYSSRLLCEFLIYQRRQNLS